MHILIMILIVLLAFLNQRLWLSEDHGFGKVRLLNNVIRAQTRDNAALAERNSALEAEVRNLKEGMDAVEERARVDLGLIRRGETFYHFLEPAKVEAAPQRSPAKR